ncbi:hypothetical protein [Helicobacter cinaedi]|uniref:hypothetical protein n=1 Tax=Helicobacter cinaedi TaxID=213 RepID=UPI0015F25CBB|nr:hypothetical protein [Helicobacter cinaedi]
MTKLLRERMQFGGGRYAIDENLLSYMPMSFWLKSFSFRFPLNGAKFEWHSAKLRLYRWGIWSRFYIL